MRIFGYIEDFNKSAAYLLTLHCFEHLHGLCHAGHLGDTHLTVAATVLEGTATRIVHHIVDDTAKRLALIVGTVGLRDKLHAHRALFEDDLLTTLVFAQSA